MTAMTGPIPYAILIVLALVGLYLALRRRPHRPAAPHPSTLFGKDTTAFESLIDLRAADPAPADPAAHRGQRPPAATWSRQVFRDIEWRRFEAVCASLFTQNGFEARTQSHGIEGGVDIWLYSHHADTPAAVVQCKHWLHKPVGVKELREFHGVMVAHKLLRGTFATTGNFTAEARDFAKSNGISALDGQSLLALISQRTAHQQKELLQIAYEGEYWRPTCVSCGLKMVERSTRKKGSAFWGCADYPRCRFRLPVQAQP